MQFIENRTIENSYLPDLFIEDKTNWFLGTLLYSIFAGCSSGKNSNPYHHFLLRRPFTLSSKLLKNPIKIYILFSSKKKNGY